MAGGDNAASEARFRSTAARSYLVAVGYPARHNRVRWGTNSLRNRPYSIAGLGRDAGAGRVALAFHKRFNSDVGKRNTETAPDPYGMSGGPIFGSRVNRRPDLRLMGFATDWKRREGLIVGTSWPTVRQFLAQVVAAA